MPSRISVMFTASSVAPRVRTTSRSRSWVIGRAGRTPCCSKAMAAASTAPIQMGRYRSPCVSLSSRIGWFPGSSTRTPTTRSSCTVRLPRLLGPVGWAVVRIRLSAQVGGRSGMPDGGAADGIHGTPESGAEQVPQSRFEQCLVQLRGQRGELAELLRGARPGLFRAGSEDRRDELLDESGLPFHAGLVHAQVARLDAVPGQPGGRPGDREIAG